MKYNDTSFVQCEPAELPLAYIREIQAAQKSGDSKRLEFLSKWGRKNHVQLTSHGGKREGAGRKPDPNRFKNFLVFVTDEQLRWLDAQPTNRSETIRSFIQSKLSLAPRASSRNPKNETATDTKRSD